MRQFIRLIALSILLATTLFWLTQGAHREWSQLYTTRTEIDPATQIEYEVREDHYVPGLDFLGLSVLVSFLVFSASFAFRRRPKGEIKLTTEPAEGSSVAEETAPEAEAEAEADEVVPDAPSDDKDEKRIT
jgi:hypothetical protein